VARAHLLLQHRDSGEEGDGDDSDLLECGTCQKSFYPPTSWSFMRGEKPV
jgi:hypothetical protein